MTSKVFIVAVVGASASGKSTFAKAIYQQLREQNELCSITLLSEDSYYRDQSHLTLDEIQQTNYDHPDAFEHDLLIRHLNDLQNGNDIDMPHYCFKTHNRKKKTTRIAPTRIIVIEGLLLFTNPALNQYFDLRIFIDTPLDLCLARRIERDIVERGRNVSSVLTQYEQQVRPMYFQFILPSRDNADIKVPGGGFNQHAIDLVKYKILSELD